MPTKLDSLLESIDPSRTYDDVSVLVDHAINTFPMHRATIENWKEYENFFADFYRHVQKTLLRLAQPPSEDNKYFFGLSIGNADLIRSQFHRFILEPIPPF